MHTKNAPLYLAILIFLRLYLYIFGIGSLLIEKLLSFSQITWSRLVSWLYSNWQPISKPTQPLCKQRTPFSWTNISASNTQKLRVWRCSKSLEISYFTKEKASLWILLKNCIYSLDIYTSSHAVHWLKFHRTILSEPYQVQFVCKSIRGTWSLSVMLTSYEDLASPVTIVIGTASNPF